MFRRIGLEDLLKAVFRRGNPPYTTARGIPWAIIVPVSLMIKKSNVMRQSNFSPTFDKHSIIGCMPQTAFNLSD
ncbi:hypothetical protein [Pseudomonas rustica]